ncbi:MAG TPA: O-antigen ligase family protein [Vicinamibacterales bacterium]|nr:O-antigen ligase family protein [Vicinamibacterales bacterium]
MLALLAIVIVAPFERVLFERPGAFAATSVEIVVAIGLGMVTWRAGPRALISGVPTAILVPGAVFLLMLLAAAALTSFEQGNAIRFVLRMLMAAWLFLVTCHVVDTGDRARRLVRTLVAVAAVVAGIAVLEAAQIPAVTTALTTFRPGFHVVGGQLRATSTLPYPTIASMYLEVAFALGLWLLLDPSPRRPQAERRLVFAALTLIGAGISATFTRAGLIAMAVAIAAVAAIRLGRVARPHAGLGALTALATTLVAVVFVAHSPELLAARLSTEGSEAWYGARYEVPKALSLRTGRAHRVPVAITNAGRLTWDSSADPAFALSYHWLRADTGAVVDFEGQRTRFPGAVRPRMRVAMEADVIAPVEPGSYTLVWDVVHETRAWLSTEGVAAARTEATVSGAPSGIVKTEMAQLPTGTMRPARPALWSAAFRMASDHPLLGVGPDNYRLAYGPYLGIERWDRRVHANNMYLEVLTGAGSVGLLAFLWFLASAGRALSRRLAAAHGGNHIAVAALCATGLVVAGHGLVDSFLSFTTTYVMFAVAAGITFSPGMEISEASHADRV